MMSAHFTIQCLDCGHQANYDPTAPSCPICASTWQDACYDYAKLAKSLPSQLAGRPFDLWRYRELLPILRPDRDLTLGEGGTPLIRANNLGKMLGCPNLYIKDERQGPTNSFKDRQAAVTISALKEAGITEMVVASTGNVAIAYSAYAARAGIKLWAFLTSLVPGAKMREVALYGTQVIKVTGSYDQAKKVAADFARQRGIFLDRGSQTLPSVEAMKTISFEVTEQLTGLLASNAGQEPFQNPTGRHLAPDWYLQSVSGGLGPLGVMKGFEELVSLGMTERVPKFGIIQAEGCSPMTQAWKQDLEVAEPVRSPKTLISTLATGDPGRTYTWLRQKILAHSGGAFESVSDDESFRAMHFLAKMEGISVEPASAVAFAGLVKMVRSGQIKPSDVVVINCTGHTLPIERHVLGQGWQRDMEDIRQISATVPEEGLLSALSRTAIDRFPRVLIADDQPDVRRLVRRILQSQGSYSLLEASNGKEAVEIACRELPDLVILDLMMPEMDGFSVLDALQADPCTHDIPVIVLTAKELTPEEKNRLHGQIQALMQKGDFMSEELLDEVRALIR